MKYQWLRTFAGKLVPPYYVMVLRDDGTTCDIVVNMAPDNKNWEPVVLRNRTRAQMALYAPWRW